MHLHADTQGKRHHAPTEAAQRQQQQQQQHWQGVVGKGQTSNLKMHLVGSVTQTTQVGPC
jgi:transcriptional regulator of nitric oxide reductase